MESFNGRLRDECLNEHRFTNLNEARNIIEEWRIDGSTTTPPTRSASAGGGPPHRRPVRDRTIDQWPESRQTSSSPAGAQCAIGRRPGKLDARATGQAVARQRCRQGGGVDAQTLASVHAVPRGWAYLPLEQRSRTSAARHCPGPKVMAVCRLRRRRPARHRHVQHHRHGQNERCRSAKLGLPLPCWRPASRQPRSSEACTYPMPAPRVPSTKTGTQTSSSAIALLRSGTAPQ